MFSISKIITQTKETKRKKNYTNILRIFFFPIALYVSIYIRTCKFSLSLVLLIYKKKSTHPPPVIYIILTCPFIFNIHFFYFLFILFYFILFWLVFFLFLHLNYLRNNCITCRIVVLLFKSQILRISLLLLLLLCFFPSSFNTIFLFPFLFQVLASVICLILKF